MTLGQYIQSCSRRGFDWGVWDCCLFAADAVKCITGKDPAARLRGIYCNEHEAQLVIEAAGGVSEIVRQAGLAPVEAPFQDGDVGVMKPGGKVSVLVVFWQGRFLGVHKPAGLHPISSKYVKEVYRCHRSSGE